MDIGRSALKAPMVKSRQQYGIGRCRILSAPGRAEPMKRVTRSCLNVAMLALTIVIHLVNAAGHERADARMYLNVPNPGVFCP
ncbi:hypothetical protein ACRPH4_07155 [Pantoea allii]|uniref:hypothetical protein n=1 Tax=Pantoea allii TaxID=574096 RepID=UPI003D7AFF6A